MSALARGNVSFRCRFCPFKTQTILSHLSHMRNHRHLTKYFFCGYGFCSGSFRTEMGLRCHVLRSHKMYVAHNKKSPSTVVPLNQEGKYRCPIEMCAEEFLTHKLFVVHLKSHLKSGTPLPCSYSGCAAVFHTYSSLTGHVSRYHRHKRVSSQHPDQQINFDLNVSPAETGTENMVCEAQESPEHQEVPIDAVSQNDSVVSLAQFYQRLEYKHMVPASVTQVVAEEMKRVCLDFKSDFLTNLSSVLEIEKLSTETISDILSAMTLRCDMLQTCHTLRTSYMRKVFFRNNFRFVEPIKVPLKNGSFFYYVPIKETIKAAFDNKSWNFSMNSFPFSPTGLLRDFYDGEVFRNNRFTQENPDSIVIIIYQDGFELACPLGPAKNLKHKIVGIYMAFGNLPSEVRFKKDAIQLVALVKECDFSHEEVYGLIVSDIIKLQENGVNLPVGNRKVHLAYIAGDNLGSHSLGGYVENFSRSEFFCRFCLLNRKAFCKRGGEVRRFRRRTVESYNDAFPRVTVHPTTGIIKSYQGVKFNSEFNDINGFHVCSPGLPSCLGHDLAEGVICYDLKLFIKHFICKGWFDKEELNVLIDSFPYSVEDMKDKPPIIKILEKNRLAGGAWQLITLLRLFPLIVFGHIDDPSDPVWKCLLLLRDIAAFCVAPEVHVSHLPALQCLIDEYLVTRRHLFPSVPLRCKHHYLSHYCEQFVALGPLIKCFTLRFESKHCFFTRSWKSSNNSINILQTLAYKHEYLQSWVRSGGGVLCETETGPRSPLVLSLYASSVVNALRKKNPSLQCEVCDHVKIKGTPYRKGDVVILEKKDMGTVLVVGTIHIILVDSSENIFFLVKRGTASLVHMYGTFMLNAAPQFDCVIPQDLLSYYPLTPYVRDTVTFIALRHAIVNDALD